MTEERLELHYHLVGNEHSMDALVRNRCEAELFFLIRHMADELGIQLTLESSACTEGGLREVLRFLLDQRGTNVIGMSTLLVAFLALIVQILSMPASPDQEQEELTKELTKLSIEEKKLQIQKLRQEAERGQPSKESVQKVAEAFNEDYKVVTRRSNFYKQLLPYSRVSAVGFGRIPAGSASPEEERITPRSDFPRFIIATDKLPELVNDEAVIEIVAPVITGGNFHWKGLYEGEVIGFAMRDAAFKESVSNRSQSFQHGDAILCILHVERKLDPVGEVGRATRLNRTAAAPALSSGRCTRASTRSAWRAGSQRAQLPATASRRTAAHLPACTAAGQRHPQVLAPGLRRPGWLASALEWPCCLPDAGWSGQQRQSIHRRWTPPPDSSSASSAHPRWPWCGRGRPSGHPLPSRSPPPPGQQQPC